MPTQLPVIPEQLPAGFCPSSYQDLLNTFSSHQHVTLTIAGRQWVFSQSKPADTTVGWWRLDSLGRPGHQYLFAQGAWLSLHPDVPGKTVWTFDALPSTQVFPATGDYPKGYTGLITFDEGSNDAISAITGPFWILATDLNGNTIAAQFPIAAGTLPSGKVLNAGDSGGEENHLQTIGELVPHTHQLDLHSLPVPETTNASYALFDPVTPPITVSHPTTFPTGSTGGSGSPPVATPMNNMPPYVVGHMLKRTRRLFYSVT